MRRAANQTIDCSLKNNARGMTLVEVMLAASVFAFCLSGLLLTYMNLFILTDLTRDLTLAAQAMQGRMEQIKSLPFATLASLNNTNFSVTGFAAGDASGIAQVYPTSYSDLKQVRLVVSFKSRKRVIGEDRNLDCVFNVSSEDANGNGRLDSPAELTTMIVNYN